MAYYPKMIRILPEMLPDRIEKTVAILSTIVYNFDLRSALLAWGRFIDVTNASAARF